MIKSKYELGVVGDSCISCYNAVHAQKLRSAALDVLGNKCVRCGINDIRVLQIDHTDGGGSAQRRKIGTSTTYRRVRDGHPGYQILCANCNWIKRDEDGERKRIMCCNPLLNKGYRPWTKKTAQEARDRVRQA